MTDPHYNMRHDDERRGSDPYQRTAPGSLDKIVENKLLTSLARIAMVIGGGLGVPLAIFVLNRVATTNDMMSEKLDRYSTKVEVLTENVKYGFERNVSDMDRLQAQVSDHEGRIRALERVPTGPVVVTPSSSTVSRPNRR